MSVQPRRNPASAIGMFSPITAILFSAVCWLVFSRLFDTHDVSALPALTRRFLGVQPWWLAAGLLGLGLSLAATLARMHGGELLLEDNQPGLRVRVKMPLLPA